MFGWDLGAVIWFQDGPGEFVLKICLYSQRSCLDLDYRFHWGGLWGEVMEIAGGRRPLEPLQATPLPLLLARNTSVVVVVVAGRGDHTQEQTRMNSTTVWGWRGLREARLFPRLTLGRVQAFSSGRRSVMTQTSFGEGRESSPRAAAAEHLCTGDVEERPHWGPPLAVSGWHMHKQPHRDRTSSLSVG